MKKHSDDQIRTRGGGGGGGRQRRPRISDRAEKPSGSRQYQWNFLTARTKNRMIQFMEAFKVRRRFVFCLR